jgi:flagellar biosynthesis protein FlhG
MTDQAERLREIVKRQREAADPIRESVDILEERKEELTRPTATRHTMQSRIIAVTSGKGGVGKTNFAINVAIHLRKQNKRVVLLDTDFGLANVEVLFGVNPKHHFGDVLAGLISVEGAMSVGPMGILFLSGGSGLTALSNVTEAQMAVLTDSFEYLDTLADIIIIDTGAGVSRSVVNFIKASGEAILVTTPEPTSITDAYALIKTVRDACGGVDLPAFKLVVNRVENPAEGTDVYEKLSGVCKRFLQLDIESLGNIPYDPSLVKAVKNQQPVALIYPNADSTRCLEAIAHKLISIPTIEKKRGIKSFIMKLTGRGL